jgi:hypothetical protein
MKSKTLWTHRESAWKPRNKQAAMVMRPALEIFLPPPVKPVVVTTPNVFEQRKMKQEQEKKRIAEVLADKAKWEAERRAQQLAQREESRAAKKERLRNVKPGGGKWIAKYQRSASKVRGFQPPTAEQLQRI